MPSIQCFHFYFLSRNNGIREQLYQNDFCCCYGEICFESVIRKYLITAMFKVLSQQLQDTLTMAYERHPLVEDFPDKILPIFTDLWIIVGVEPVPRHLTYCSMLFFLSSKPSFCYSNNFCCNLFTFLCLKDAPPLINFSNVFQPEYSYSNPPPLFSLKH